MSTQEQYVASADGTQIWAEAAGDPHKPAVVFIHGLACSALGFDRQFDDPELLQSLYMVRYEMRGHGRTGTPDEIEAYASKHQAEDFRAVCHAFGVKKPFVFGWSLGASVPVDVANHYGASFLSGVIYCGGPVISLRLCLETIQDAWKPLMPAVLSTDANISTRFARTFADSCVANPGVTLPWPIKLQFMGAFGSQPPQVRAFSHNREQDETRWRAEARHWPVLLLQGTEDAHCITDVVVMQARSLYDDVEVRVMQGVGHAPQFERAGEVNRALLYFVRRAVE